MLIKRAFPLLLTLLLLSACIEGEPTAPDPPAKDDSVEKKGSGGSSGPKADTADPVLHLASPSRASFHPVGSTVKAHGTIKDASKIVKLTAYLDGIAHEVTGSLTDAGFSLEMKIGRGGLHSLKLEATDSAGNVGRTKVSFFGGVAKPSGSLAPHAIGAAITREGLAVVAELVEAALAPEKVGLFEKLSAANPVWSGKKGPVSAELHVTAAKYGGVSLALVPEAGGLHLSGRIADLSVALKAKIKAGLKFSLSGSVSAHEATFSGTARAAKSETGKLLFGMHDVAVDLHGFSFDIAKFPGVLESLARKAVEKFIEKKLAELIEEKVPALLSGELGELTLSRTVTLGGHKIKVSGTLGALAIAPTGVDAVIGTAIEATEPDAFHEPLGGFLYTPNAGAPPEHPTSSMFYLAVSDDTINQALYEAYRAGALKFDLTKTIKIEGLAKDLSVAFLEAYLGLGVLDKAGLGPETPITLAFDATLPPVVHLRKAAAGLAVISLHELKLTIHAGKLKLFGFAVDLTLPIGIEVSADARLSPTLHPAHSGIDLRITDEPLIDLDNKLFEPLLADLTRAVLPTLLSGIDGLPLPKVASLKLSGVRLETRGDYLQIFADLTGAAGAGGKTSGSFSALTYNVAGLPEGISDSSPSRYQPLISPMLNKYDLVLVQEDFFYHDLLTGEVDHPHVTTPAYDFLKKLKIASDGLNRFSRSAFSKFSRTIWATSNGFLDAGSDALSAKGFSFARHTLAPGVTVDVYNLHADAGGSAGDVAARTAQFKQLAAYIALHSAGRAVIVAGDTNLHGFKAVDEPVLTAFLAAAGLTDVARHLATKIEKIDRFMYRSSSKLKLTPTRWRVASEFVTSDGKLLSDHEAIQVNFDWKVVGG